MRFEVYTPADVKVAVFWAVIGDHRPDDGGSKHL
jgi:hypothetical protein